MSIELNISPLILGLQRLEKRQMASARIGMEDAVKALLDDCLNEQPSVPLRDGALRSSGSAYVDGKHVAGGGTPVADVPKPDMIQGTVIFDGPYAAYQHEGMRRDGTHVVKNYTTPGTGAKYIEAKLHGHPQKYIQIVAESIKRNA